MAPIAFFFLFPGFFFYQTLIGIGAIGAYLGGYFSIASLSFFFPLSYAYYLALRSARYWIASADLKFGIFLLYFLLVVLINAGFGADRAIVQTHLLSILYFVNIYIIFKYIDFSQRNTRLMVFASLAIMSATIFFFSQDGGFQPGKVGTPLNQESVATYQGFARSYALTFITVVCFTKLAFARFALYAVAVAALFLNGSRSELVAVLFSAPIVEIYRAQNGLRIFCIVVLAGLLLGINPQDAMQSLPDNRVWELFDLSHSQSANSRLELTQHALHTIEEYPVLGDYGSYPPGEYSHNILSAWVDLGLFGFLYLLFMLLHTAVRLFIGGWLIRPRSSQYILAWTLICMSLFLLVTAKTFDDMFTGAAMGAYANFRNRKRQAITANNL
jgi:hypothetical protein